MMREVSSLELVEGGNIIRQGEYFRLGYLPRDVDGQPVNLDGKDITVAILKRSQIVHETVAEFDPGDGLIHLYVDQNIGNGKMWLEFTVTEPNFPSYRKKFPSRQERAVLDIVPGAEDLPTAGVGPLTVEQLRTEQAIAQQEYESVITPKVDVMQQRLEEGISAFTEDTELKDARMGKTNLRQFNEEVIGKLAEKATILNTEIIYTVGENGDFTTINEALEKITNKYPSYKFNSEGIGITLLLKSGFVMKEQVIVNALNLSWISIKSEDVEVVIDRQYLTVSVGAVDRYPAWTFTDGAISPKIYVLFNMNETGSGEQRNGFNVRLGSTILLQLGAGCKNAGGRGLHLAYGFGYANGCNFSGAGQAGVRVANGSRLFGDGMNVSDSLIGIMADEGYATARGTTANNCGTAIRAVRSNIDFKGGTANDCGTVLSGEEQSEVILASGEYKRYTNTAIVLLSACRVYADFSNFSEGVGRVIDLNNSELSARYSNLVSADEVTLVARTSRVDITSSQIKRVSMLHGSHVNAKSVNATAYTGATTIFTLSGRGNTLIMEGSGATVNFPKNQLLLAGIIYD